MGLISHLKNQEKARIEPFLPVPFRNYWICRRGTVGQDRKDCELKEPTETDLIQSWVSRSTINEFLKGKSTTFHVDV